MKNHLYASLEKVTALPENGIISIHASKFHDRQDETRC
jgi:hypothetical protein